MVKYILETTKSIMEGRLHYQAFTKALNTTPEFAPADKQKVRLLVNTLLNRYFRYLYSLTAAEETNLSTSEVLALGLYSYNVEKNVIPLIYDDVLKTLPAATQVKLEAEYPAHIFPIKIPQYFHEHNPELAYATRFGVPLFVIEQLMKDVGKKNIARFLARRPQENCGLINTKVINEGEFFTKYPNFIKGEHESSFVYEGSEYIKKTSAYDNNEVILTTQSLFEISQLIGEKAPKTLLFMQYEETSLLLLLALTYPNLVINYSAVEPKSKFILQHLIKKFDLTNVTYVNTITHTYDLVLTTLSSSGLNGNIRHRDFYFRINEDLTTYSSKAASELVNVKDYVNETGTLLFLTNTALRNETHYQALSFIRDNPEFVLVREKQYFHFNDLHETIYYALFEKGGLLE